MKFDARKRKCSCGPHPTYMKGSGWCQLTFQEESVKLCHDIFGMHLGVDVKAESLRGDDKVNVWTRSEECDPKDRCV